MKIISQTRENYDKFNILAFVCDKCNYDCWYCYNKKPRSNKLLNLNTLFLFIKNIKRKIKKCIEVDLIGGEPTLHPELYNFCKKINQNFSDIIVTIYTNFSLPVEQIKRYVNENVKFEASWHSKNYDFFKKIALFDPQCFRAITIMFEPEFSNFCIDRYNYLRKNRYDVDLQPIIYENENNLYTDIQKQQFNKIIDNDDKLFKLKYDNGKEEIVSHNQILLKTNYNYKRWLCSAGIDLLYIDCNGNIYPCPGVAQLKNNFNAIFNISQFQNETNVFQFKKTFCKVDKCPHEDNVQKIRIF